MIRKILIFIVVASLLLFGHIQYAYSPNIREPVMQPVEATEDEFFQHELVPPTQKDIPPKESVHGENVFCTTDCPLIDPETGF